MSRLLDNIMTWPRRVYSFCQGLLVPLTGAGRGALAASLGVLVLISGYILSGYLPLYGAIFLTPVLAGLAALVGALAAMLLYGLMKLLFNRVFTGILGLLIGSAIILSVLGYPNLFFFLLAVPLLAAAAALAALIIALRGFAGYGWLKRITLVCLLLFVMALGVSGTAWVRSQGTAAHLVSWLPGEALLPALDLPDPATRGDYPVMTLFYGSGTDIHRPEYGPGVDLVTPTVDVTPFLPETSNFRLKLRARYWGFELSESPLNGRVWYPQGEGPFPLVLIVHGNHEMRDFSDPGYAYLGELLASRGYIAVSVDQNFLNGSNFAGDLGGKANAGRGWLLLEHLKVWREWQQTPGNTFYGKVDLEGITLIGHSRGGEAVAIAAAFNSLSHFPGDANITFDYNFNIKSLVAFAPTDQFYTPADRSIVLEDINYLLIHGAHDGDVSVFMGNRQYQRTRFSGRDYGFKSVVYIYQANHGQFNTGWGNRDIPAPLGRLLNIKPLMKAEDQRRIAEVYISAFLEATIQGETGYLPLFRDYRTGAAWLPEGLIINRFQDSTFQAVADFEEGLDPSLTSLPGVRLRGENLTLWREGLLSFRMESMKQANNVVFLGWNREEKQGTPSYTVELPYGLTGEWGLRERDILTFSMADLSEEPLDKMTLVLVTGQGEHRLNIPLTPPLTIRFTKLGFVEGMILGPVEPVLVTYQIPLQQFNANPGDIRAIRFEFTSPSGEVALDDIGFMSPVE